MCFDYDSDPPIAPGAGPAPETHDVVLTADDDNRFQALYARARDPIGAGMVVLPDVRGLFPYYETLAVRFAEAGIDALAIDYFGRTAGVGRRGPDFDFAPHVMQTTFAGQVADVTAAVAYLRHASGERVAALHTMGFCFGGRLAFNTTTFGLDLAGAVGFYGWPVGTLRNDAPAPANVADRMRAPLLAIFGGADPGIPDAAVAEFRESLRAANVAYEIVTYAGAPHSFFDRKAAEFAVESEDAWARVLSFVRAHVG
jgi:carboxymethylenebutenolidase